MQRLYDDYLNPNKLEGLSAIISDDLVNADGSRGAAGFGTVMSRLRGGFPDLHYTIEELVAEGDRVVARWTLRGTHTGTFRDIAPTGRKIVNNGFAIFRVVDGRIVESIVETDRLGFLLAIGRIPYDPVFGPPPRTE
ncbi:MAG: ester cyclase [Kofleriaceae bacterium]